MECPLKGIITSARVCSYTYNLQVTLNDCIVSRILPAITDYNNEASANSLNPRPKVELCSRLFISHQ